MHALLAAATTPHRHLTWLNAYWALWLLLFIIPEMWAVFFSHNLTLSDTVWTLEGIDLRQPFDFPMWTNVHWIVAGIIWGLFAWLSLHLPFGLLR